ncbi:MAG: type II toxin-antitoxin system RelE/ParE family toxin [Nitrospirae bacterium]|nr:MAG: type II toxin-antitoxin system RelE/ParE family toxin [Nitrospirota bacterium]
MARVTWTDPALESLKVIFEYIAEDSFVYAERVVTNILNAPKKLGAFPLCGRVVPEFQDENIRELIYGSYRIIYQIRQDTCYVVAVIHGSRDILIHLKPGEWDIT